MDAFTSVGRKRKWAHQWYLCRERFGHTQLLNELQNSDPDVYMNFLRKKGESFDELLDLVRPYIPMRNAISPFERIRLCLIID